MAAPAADEHVVLVDRQDRETGTMEKLAAHRAGVLHRAFSVFVFNGRGELLLQRRAATKYHSAGLWTNTCCGHPRPGEATAAAAARRLGEEMGFTCPLSPAFPFIYEAELPNGLREHELDHVFLGRFDGAVRPNPAEADAHRFVSPVDLLAEVQLQPGQFTVWFLICLERALAAAESGGFAGRIAGR